MEADMIFTNGEVITVDDTFTVNEALAVKGTDIIFCGLNEDVRQFKGPYTKEIDLNGNSLLPGFIDAHAHLELYGTNQLGVNCKDVQSIGGMVEKLKEAVNGTPKGQWIRGWGYNQNALDEARHPNRWDLDQVSTEHPIIIVRTCGHISAVNSKALSIAGIDQNSSDPTGGKYVRNSGVPTGVLLEAAHMNMFMNAMHSENDILTGLEQASKDFLKKGITSVHDAGGYNTDHFRHLQKAVQTGKIKQRVYALIGSLHESPVVLDKALEAGMITGLGDEWFKIGPAKVFIDGSSSGPTAKMKEPYTSNPDQNGILYLNQNELNDVLGKAHELGWQITAHAIGDKAVEMMIDCIEFALGQRKNTNHRHRIEHAGVSTPDLVSRMKELNIIPIPNPAFIYEFGDGYINDYGERVQNMFPARSLLNEGLWPAMGSDSPITTFDPMIGIQAAVTRKSKLGNEIGKSQAITVQEAIALYTRNGAYASFEENLKGSLEVGKRADMVVLDRSILSTPSESLHKIDISKTFINGKVVYETKREVAR